MYRLVTKDGDRIDFVYSAQFATEADALAAIAHRDPELNKLTFAMHEDEIGNEIARRYAYWRRMAWSGQDASNLCGFGQSFAHMLRDVRAYLDWNKCCLPLHESFIVIAWMDKLCDMTGFTRDHKKLAEAFFYCKEEHDHHERKRKAEEEATRERELAESN